MITEQQKNQLKKEAGLTATNHLDEDGNVEWIGTDKEWRSYENALEAVQKDEEVNNKVPF